MTRYSRIKDFSETHNGILKKRGELFTEAERIAERLGEIKNSIAAFDRTLRTIGYEGDLDAIMPRQRREVIFGQGHLLEAVLLELRCADRPLKSRELAQNIMMADGHDIRDRDAVSLLTKRVSKCLRRQQKHGVIIGKMDASRNMEWILRPRVG